MKFNECPADAAFFAKALSIPLKAGILTYSQIHTSSQISPVTFCTNSI